MINRVDRVLEWKHFGLHLNIDIVVGHQELNCLCRGKSVKQIMLADNILGSV